MGDSSLKSWSTVLLQLLVGVIKHLFTTVNRNIRWFQQFTTLRYPNRFAPLQPAEIQRIASLKRKTLVLDLDETLIHSQHDGLGRGGPARSTKTSDFTLNVVIDSHPVSFYVYKRPHVDYFLQTVSQWYDLVVFTASMEVYGSAVCDKLDPHKSILRKRYYRQDCRMEYHSYTKDLATVNSDLSSIFILDNSPGAYRHYVENAVPIKSWFSDPHDTCLLNLLPMLDALRFTKDVRSVLQRNRINGRIWNRLHFYVFFCPIDFRNNLPRNYSTTVHLNIFHFNCTTPF